jgi:prepilin-type N-terminal cleavage/methylation domain-containing protein
VTRLHRRLHPESDAGFTLIEVLAAIVVFGLVSLAGTAMILNSIGISRDTRNRSQAASLAARQLEVVRNASTQSCWTAPAPAGCALVLTPGSTSSTTTVGSQAFTVTQSLSWLAKAAPTGACDSPTQGGNSAVQPVLLATESVTWPAMLGTKPVQAATELAPPVGLFSANTGGISVKVLDHANSPVGNIPVTVQSSSGGPTTSLVTNSDGCTFAAYLAPGSYTITLAQSGYIDNQEQTTSTQTVAVTSGAVATGSFYFDKAAQIAVSFTGAPAATGLPLTVYNSGLGGLGTLAFGPGVTTLSPLYPYPGYGVWAGTCPEANPSAVDVNNVPLYSGGNQTQVATTAGGSTPASIPLYPLTVNVTSGGVPVAGAVVSLQETNGSAKTACTSLHTYGLTTSAAGGISFTGVPLGHFTVTASQGGKTGSASVFVTLSGGSTAVNLS